MLASSSSSSRTSSPLSLLLLLLAVGSALLPLVAGAATTFPHHTTSRADAGGVGAGVAPRDSRLCETAKYENKTRLFVLTDISNEPDDQMSLVRLLAYANELDIVGLAAVTSTWLNDTVDIATIFAVVNDGYARVVDNLNSHVPVPSSPRAGYPPAEHLAARVVAGHPLYGLAAVFDAPARSNASAALVAAVDEATEANPQWVSVWGGANVLAEALYEVNRTRDAGEVAAFVRKLRVYSISDQDNAGAWVRANFPTLFYIVSVHGFSEYSMPTWAGISGEKFRHFDRGGPDFSLVTNDWLQTHIRVGPLGTAYYLNWSYIMEGDTPSFLGLLPNGLNEPAHPEWGGWGGRYLRVDADGSEGLFGDAADWVVGSNNETFLSRFASIWRWRAAYQFDFAARMAWSATPAQGGNGSSSDSDSDSNATEEGEADGGLNHPPYAVVNGSCGTLQVPFTLGGSVALDASASWDPDGDALVFEWFHYREPTFRLEGDIPRVSPNVTFDLLDEVGSVVNVTPNDNETMHIILTVQDDRAMPLTAYRRVILVPQS